MNTGQMMLVTCALVLLGATVLSVNRNSLNNGTILRQTELGIYAVSLATSYIQRAGELDWDEKTVGGLVFITVPMPQPPNIPAADATAPGNLGRDVASEKQGHDETFNDFDDYRGFVEDTVIGQVGEFFISADVYYVDLKPPYGKNTTNTTWAKEIDMRVWNTIDRNVFQGNSATQTGTDTIRMSYIYAFYR